MSPQKWIKETNAIGIISKSGNNGGTYARSDIALEFASWLSPEFKLYVIQEFERLKRNKFYQYKPSNPALTHNDPWITNCITRIPFSAATSPPSDGPPKCRPPTSGGRRKNP